MITYFAYYQRPDGKFSQVRVELMPGKFSQRNEEFTGVTYRTQREAIADMARLNCKSA